MKYRNNPIIDLVMLIVTVLALWTAVFIKDSAQEKITERGLSNTLTMHSR